MSKLFLLEFQGVDDDPRVGALGWEDFWPRKFASGDALAYVGALSIVTVTRPFTAFEDAVFKWVRDQDDCTLSLVYPLRDGRDLMLLDRLHTRQDIEAAVLEQQTFIASRLASLSVPTQHATR